jgi:hypothetical protein
MANAGLSYVHSQRDRSAIYLDALPLFTSGRVRLLDNPRLAGQLSALERRTSTGGRDLLDAALALPETFEQFEPMRMGKRVSDLRETRKNLLFRPSA